MNSSASINCNTNANRGYETKHYEESDNRSGIRGIRRSFNMNHREALRPVGHADKQISYGDRLFARLVMHGRTVLEFMMNSINDLTELWGELRRKCRGISGLAKLYLRNASRGWSMERPLMIYPDGYQRTANKSTPATTASTVYSTFTTPDAHNDKISQAFRGKAHQLSFRW
ncbi:MAG: hypothetical protein K2K97_05365 [Muribaculaceae bacterium]|nr:hypothetical protein [Muribaculaceae bacterium]